MHTLGDVITAGMILAALIVVPYKIAKAWLWPALMSRWTGAPATIAVPGTVGTASTNAPNLPDRDISADAWIVALASATDEKGRPKFSASKIFALLGGHRATVLARVKEIQEGIPPPQFRQDDGSTAPAEYPVTKPA